MGPLPARDQPSRSAARSASVCTATICPRGCGDGAFAGSGADLTAFQGAEQRSVSRGRVGRRAWARRTCDDFSASGAPGRPAGAISCFRVRSSPSRRRRDGGSCRSMPVTASSWRPVSPSGSVGRRSPAGSQARASTPTAGADSARGSPAPVEGTGPGPPARRGRRHREGRDGPPLRVGRHGGRMAEGSTAPASSSTPTGSTASRCRA